MIDFDAIDTWAPQLSAALAHCASSTAVEGVAKSSPEYVEDALDTLFSLAPRDAIVRCVLDWITSNTLMGYHGTRLSKSEVADVRSNGLRPLDAPARSSRLVRALQGHPNWRAVACELDVQLHRHGAGNAAGGRVGQVHLTLSKAALVHGFNHYLTHGSEFDQHVAHALLGDEGVRLLSADGCPILVSVAVPGDHAVRAAHIHFSPEELLKRGDIPNLVQPFLRAWAFKLANPAWQSSALRTDCGMRFDGPVPPQWIIGLHQLGSELVNSVVNSGDMNSVNSGEVILDY